MYKKIMGTVVGILIFAICSTGSFADLTIEFEDGSDLMLIEPNIGSENQIMLRESLTISIRPQDEPTVYIGLSKIMPSCIDDDLNGFIDEVCEEFHGMVGDTFDKKAQEDVVTDDQNAEAYDEVYEEEYEEEVGQTDEQIAEYRETVISDFSKRKEKFQEKIEEFQEIYEMIHKNFPDGLPVEEDGAYTQNAIIGKYKIALNNIVNEIDEFKQHEIIYTELFESDMFEPELIAPTGVLPYYQKTVEEMVPGYYQLKFLNEDRDDILEIIDFEVIDKELMTEENIKDVMDDFMNPLANP